MCLILFIENAMELHYSHVMNHKSYALITESISKNYQKLINLPTKTPWKLKSPAKYCDKRRFEVNIIYLKINAFKGYTNDGESDAFGTTKNNFKFKMLSMLKAGFLSGYLQCVICILFSTI